MKSTFLWPGFKPEVEQSNNIQYVKDANMNNSSETTSHVYLIKLIFCALFKMKVILYVTEKTTQNIVL